MAIMTSIGFIFVCVVSFWFTVGGLTFILGFKFFPQKELLIIGLIKLSIGMACIYYAYNNSPFELIVK